MYSFTASKDSLVVSWSGTCFPLSYSLSWHLNLNITEWYKHSIVLPDKLTSLSIISVLLPCSIWLYHCHGPGLLVTQIQFDPPRSDPVNVLLDFLHRQTHWGPQNLVLDADTVEQVTPHQRVGESVEETFDSEHRRTLKKHLKIANHTLYWYFYSDDYYHVSGAIPPLARLVIWWGHHRLGVLNIKHDVTFCGTIH